MTIAHCLGGVLLTQVHAAGDAPRLAILESVKSLRMLIEAVSANKLDCHTLVVLSPYLFASPLAMTHPFGKVAQLGCIACAFARFLS